MKFFDINRLLGNTPQQGELPSSKELVAQTMRVAWPAMLESFMVSIVGIIDTMMVGTLGAVAIAGVALTTQPKFIALAIFMSFNVAVSAVVARRVGERDREDANRVLGIAVTLTVIATVFVSYIMVHFAEVIISIMGGEPDATVLAIEYIVILIGGLGFTTISLCINAAQRGAGNTKIAMRTNLVSNTANVILNYLLIGGNLGFPA